jgi:RNA polymerase sigma-70 factor (ECF subfamily)
VTDAPSPLQPPQPVDERALVAALRRGDEAVFAALVDRHHVGLVRVAERFVSGRAVAEEVAQEAWLGFLTGLDRFEGRSSIRTWLYRIVVNIARTRGTRDARVLPFASVGSTDDDGTTVDADRFVDGHWGSPVRPWDLAADTLTITGEAQERIRAAIDRLPAVQRQVITLRDVEGLESDEVCDLLDITPGNQRVLLHRARAAVRGALEEYFTP